MKLPSIPDDYVLLYHFHCDDQAINITKAIHIGCFVLYVFGVYNVLMCALLCTENSYLCSKRHRAFISWKSLWFEFLIFQCICCKWLKWKNIIFGSLSHDCKHITSKVIEFFNFSLGCVSIRIYYLIWYKKLSTDWNCLF